MGKIIETTYHDTIGKITSFAPDLINNSFYILNDKKPTIVTYYNINTEATSLDPGSKLSYDNIGEDSPIRYNRIEDFIIYGFTRVELQTENDEFGLEAEKISGECYILPNTIKPTEGDYFEVEHIKDSTWLFIVSDVQQDTLENGSNVYKIQYKLEYVDHDRILDNVVEDFRMIEKREGTNVAKVVESKKYAEAKKMDEIAVYLKHEFCDLFYNDKVQTFTFVDLTEWRIYDPFMIEFLIRNKILDNGEDSFIHVCHQLEVARTFSIDYDRTFLRCFENKRHDKIVTSDREIKLEDIISYGSIFASRFETYFKARYVRDDTMYGGTCFPNELAYAISEHKLIDAEGPEDIKPLLWQNVLVKYFYNERYTEEELLAIEENRFGYAKDAFYIIPLLILCLEDAIENALK